VRLGILGEQEVMDNLVRQDPPVHLDQQANLVSKGQQVLMVSQEKEDNLDLPVHLV